MLTQTLRGAAMKLIEPLSGRSEGARQAALEAIRRAGKKIILVLAAELEGETRLRAAAIEAGNAITGTAYDPSSEDGLKEKAAAWRAWHEKNR